MKEYGKEEKEWRKWDDGRRTEEDRGRRTERCNLVKCILLSVYFLNCCNLNLAKHSLYSADEKGAMPIEVCM